MRFLLAMLLFCQAAQAQMPVIFVHGNGDDATKWVPVIWLFESNGYPASRLFAIRLTDPAARREDSKPEAFRSSTTDQASEVSAFVTRVLLETKAKKVALVGSSRGGMTIRNFLKNAGGAAVVSHAVLCGTPNHGVMATDTNLDMEFNGKGHFLRQLNEDSELVDGVQFLTIRSDKNDKYAQPNVGYDGPELKGAENVVLPGLDHREVAFHPLAFAETFRFLTGDKPKYLKPLAEATPKLSGLVTSFVGMAPTNRPQAGVKLSVFALKPGTSEREGDARYSVTTNETGSWGPLVAQPDLTYEFRLEKDGRAVSYFMSGLARSTALLNFRFVPGGAKGLTIHRPQGYLSKGRDALMMNGKLVEELAEGVPTRDSVTVIAQGGVKVELRGETVYARASGSDNEVNIVELIWD
ncbi:MAG: lipase [Acidobacteria bacterium]|nr:lipase [Acidobacteriota bacterium]